MLTDRMSWGFMQCCPIDNSVHCCFVSCVTRIVCSSALPPLVNVPTSMSDVVVCTYIHTYILLTLPCILCAQMSLSVLSVQKAKTGSATRTLTEPRSLQTVILLGHSFPPGSIIKGLYPISWQWNGVLAHQADCPVQTTNLEGCIVIVDNGVYHLRQR